MTISETKTYTISKAHEAKIVNNQAVIDKAIRPLGQADRETLAKGFLTGRTAIVTKAPFTEYNWLIRYKALVKGHEKVWYYFVQMSESTGVQARKVEEEPQVAEVVNEAEAVEEPEDQNLVHAESTPTESTPPVSMVEPPASTVEPEGESRTGVLDSPSEGIPEDRPESPEDSEDDEGSSLSSVTTESTEESVEEPVSESLTEPLLSDTLASPEALPKKEEKKDDSKFTRKRSPSFTVEEEQRIIAMQATLKDTYPNGVNGMLRKWILERLGQEEGKHAPPGPEEED